MTSVASGAAARIVRRRSAIGPRRSAGSAAMYSSTVVGSGIERIIPCRTSERQAGDGRGRRWNQVACRGPPTGNGTPREQAMTTHADHELAAEPTVELAESRNWDRFFRVFFKTTPHP